MRRLNPRAVGDDMVFGNDDDAVADVVERMVDVAGFAFRGDNAVIADASVFIDDGVFDAGVFADADGGFARGALGGRDLGFVIIATHHDGAM